MKDKCFKIVGLTGGIGSGKSTVSKYLSERDFAVIDADKTAREIVTAGSPILNELVNMFGGDILKEDGNLNRKKLAEIMFADSALKERVEALMHGEVFRRIRSRINELMVSGAGGTVFLDIPLLFETDAHKMNLMDEIWLVDADEETRITRVMRRDEAARQDVLKIMSHQMSSAEKRKHANIIIENSGSEEALYQQLYRLVGR